MYFHADARYAALSRFEDVRNAAMDWMRYSAVTAEAKILRPKREFEEPLTFDIGRKAERHLSLGQGAHFCMGSALARMEAKVAFEELLACMPEFDVTARPERIRSAWAWGFESLDVEFAPR